jgi:EAL domain-containing protein (putative c-di-GMP-specific phosphodiesterase class I)
MLSQLRSVGIQLYMDDFGTGYSSLSYLHRFPMDTLKIDRSFVNRMGVDGENLEIVRAIVTLAHNLGMNVTAEGVETTEQLALLKALKCEYGQGYFFSKPVDSIQAEALIAAQTLTPSRPPHAAQPNSPTSS